MYKPCYIKNISGASLTLRSKVLDIDEVYQVIDSERINWSEDDTVLAAITGEDAQIGQSETTLITSYSDQIDWLKSDNPIDAVIDYTNKYEKMLDAVSVQCPLNTTTNLDLKIVNFSGESFAYKWLWGGIAFGDCVLGDSAAFSIVDVDNILGAGAGYVVKHYVRKLYMKPLPAQVTVFSETPAAVPVGLYLRCAYTAVNSGNTRTVCINYDLNNVEE